MYTLMTIVKIKPEFHNIFLEQINYNAANSIANEAGCIRFDVARGANDHNIFYLYEIYDSESSFTAHGSTPHFKIFKERVAGCFADEPKTIFLDMVYKSEIKATNYFDASITLDNQTVCWPNDPPFIMDKVLDINESGICNLSKISLGLHTGTHMDAPLHFLDQADDIISWPLNAGIGRVRVIKIANPLCITKQELQAHNIKAGERILFKTKNSDNYWGDKKFMAEAVYIAVDAAQFLAESKVLTVGVDYLSVGNQDPAIHETHRILFRNKIWIIEGLNLVDIDQGEYEMIALPLKIKGAEASPTRIILQKI